ncbi:hypothetical protein [Micromonospora arida]|uniref:hypothetical protein n=1 Tax=Micromonospora arida TaxID=2203715 RepID=UPI0033D5762D
MKEFGFWLGLALSIPLSILANFATPVAGRLISKSSKSLRGRRQEKAIRYETDARWLIENPPSLMAFILHLTARSFYSLSGLLAGVALLIPSTLLALQGDNSKATWGYAIALAGTLISSSILSRRIERAARMAEVIRKIQGGPDFE